MVLATSSDVASQSEINIMRLASVCSTAKPSVGPKHASRRSQLWLIGDLDEPQGKYQVRQIISYLAAEIEGNRSECESWIRHGTIESLGGMTPDHLVDQGLGMLVVDFLLEILAGKRG